jgi:ketosteroid isomerase-like protein
VSRDEISTLRSLYEHWARGDFRSSDLFDPEIEFSYSSDFPDPTSYTGVAAFAEGWKRWLSEWDHVTVTCEELIELDDGSVLALVKIRGSGKASGAPMEGDGANLWRFRDGKAVSIVAYANREHALRDAGLTDGSEPA